MSKYIVDTTVLVELLRGNGRAKAFLETNHPDITVITVAELIQGARNKEDLTIINKTIGLFNQISAGPTVWNLALELLKRYNLSHGLLLLDALIASCAIVKKKMLVTGNYGDFKFISELKVVNQDKILK